MYRGNKPKIIPILIVVVIAALVIAAIVSIGRMFFTSGSTDSNVTSESQQIREDTLNTAMGRAVRFTERGPIVADEGFKSYQIVVTPTERRYTTYAGYLDRVVNSRTYANNTRAYEELVYALDKANISRTQNTNDGDIRGVCATNGRLYVYETTNNDAVTHTLWTSTCSGSKGNMAANAAQVKALFVNQIPDFEPAYMSATANR